MKKEKIVYGIIISFIIFIFTTILIRLSFSVEGLLNNILIISSVSYGLIMLLISINFNKIQIKYPEEIQIEEKESDEIV